MGRGGGERATRANAGRRSAGLPLSGASVRELREVYHLGTMRAADKGGRYTSSYEGHGLSVSRDPDEWQRIARLGGAPRWLLRNRGGRFLDAHSLSDAERRVVEQWAIERGLARRAPAWRVTVIDGESEEEGFFLFFDRQEAQAEAETYEGAPQRVQVLAPTVLLEQRIGMDSGVDCFDHVLPLFVEAEREDLDGVWWEDEYGHWSAPRGVIVPTRLERWERRLIRRP